MSFLSLSKDFLANFSNGELAPKQNRSSKIGDTQFFNSRKITKLIAYLTTASMFSSPPIPNSRRFPT